MSNRWTIAETLWVHTKRLAMTQFLGHRQSAFKGNWIAFAESRPYQTWDPEKRIDRKTTAKKWWELYVKEFEEERQLRFLCAIDSGSSMRHEYDWRVSKFSIASTIAKLFWYAWSQLWDQVGWVWFIDRCWQYFVPKQWLRSLPWFEASLERLYKKELTEKSSLEKLLKTLVWLRIKNSIIVICCDDMLDKSLSTLRWLAARNDVIIVHCFDPFEVTLSSSTIKQWLFGFWSKAYYAVLWWKQQEQYKENFETKRAITERLIRKSWADYCMIQTDQDPMLELTKFFNRRKNYR